MERTWVWVLMPGLPGMDERAKKLDVHIGSSVCVSGCLLHNSRPGRNAVMFSKDELEMLFSDVFAGN